MSHVEFDWSVRQEACGQQKGDKADHRQNTVEEEGSFGLKPSSRVKNGQPTIAHNSHEKAMLNHVN